MRQFAFSLNIGSVRVKNQDQVTILQGKQCDLMLVCDGMGGANAGEVASLLTLESIQKAFTSDAPKSLDFTSLKNWSEKVLNQANLEVLKMAHDNPSYNGMGTTAVLALISTEAICIANVGDSRAYVVKEGKLRQVSEDHSLVNQWIKEGKMTLEESRVHPQRSVLTNVLGVMDHMLIDCFEVDKNVDMILLCSDGVTGMLNDSQIEAFINQGGTVKQISKRLEKAAIHLGGYDNIAIALMSEDHL